MKEWLRECNLAAYRRHGAVSIPIGRLTAVRTFVHASFDNRPAETAAGLSIDRVTEPKRLAPAIAARVSIASRRTIT
jgi:hypothetical protein